MIMPSERTATPENWNTVVVSIEEYGLRTEPQFPMDALARFWQREGSLVDLYGLLVQLGKHTGSIAISVIV